LTGLKPNKNLLRKCFEALVNPQQALKHLKSLIKHSLMKNSRTITALFSSIFLIFMQVSSQAQTIYGLTTDNKLVSFNAATPGVIMSMPTIFGVKTGQTLVGLDVRPATGEIFALGYNSANDSATVYTLDSVTGAATAKATSVKLTGLGNAVGFDFNPTVDRIRLVSKTGKSFRLNPNNGAIAATDSTVRYATTDVNRDKTAGVTACAYTNSYIGATGTALYDFDETQNVMALQNPPNDGILNTQPALSGTRAGATISDLDIYTNPTTFASTVFAVVKTGTTDSLFTLNLATGVLTKVANIGAAVTDIAVKIDRTIPALQGNLAYGLSFTAGNAAFNLLRFDVKNPTFIRASTVITGLKTGQALVGMDIRPQDNRIYAVGYRAADSVATIYTLNDTTSALSVYAGADSFKIALGTAQAAVDFNPSANRLRIIGATNRNNYRLNLTVSPITVTLDTALTFKTTDVNAGKTPNVVTGAYTNSYNGATATQLYDIETGNNILANQNTANGGFLATTGALGLTLDPADLSVDLDIYSTPNPAVDSAFLAANITGSGGADNLYSVNIANGSTALIGRIGLGIAVRNIAVRLANVRTATTDLKSTLKADLFPNPASNLLNIVLDNEFTGAVKVQIMDISGAVVLQKVVEKTAKNFQTTLNINGLTSGTYFVRISTEKEVTVKKLVKTL
jgi:hypothetical protein